LKRLLTIQTEKLDGLVLRTRKGEPLEDLADRRIRCAMKGIGVREGRP